MRATLSLALACATLAACSSTPTKPAASIPVTPVAPKTVVATVPVATPSIDTEAQKFDRIVRILANKSIYFDYDKFVVKPEYRDILKQDYEVLKAAPQGVIVLQGNADERGSAEYNLALGQKRAEAVAQALKLLGVKEAQVEAVSFGKEKPRATCHEEKCWAENRRVDVTYRRP